MRHVRVEGVGRRPGDGVLLVYHLAQVSEVDPRIELGAILVPERHADPRATRIRPAVGQAGQTLVGNGRVVGVDAVGHVERVIDTLHDWKGGIEFSARIAVEPGAVVPAFHGQLRPRRRRIVVDDPSLETVGAQEIEIEELARILGIGLVEPLVGEFDPLMGIDVEAQLAPEVAIEVAGWDLLAVSSLVVAALALAVTHAESPSPEPPPDTVSRA